MLKRPSLGSFLALLVFLSITTGPVGAQILDPDPESAPVPEKRPEHLGLAYSGSSGLGTIPTADIQESRNVSVSFKSRVSNWEAEYGNVQYDMKKKEQVVGLALNPTPNIELSVAHLDYRRETSPVIPELNFSEDPTTFGMKYSAPHGSQNFCMGFTFAPMESEELNRADLFQIEQLRSIYMTIGEEISSGLHGYLHLRNCYTKKQEIKLPNGNSVKVDTKEFLVSGVALEYRWLDHASVFCEGKFGNYRDIFTQDSTRATINVGLRFGTGNYQLEVLGLSLSDDPSVAFGGTIGF